MHKNLTRQEILDLYFVEARHKLIDIGAFLGLATRTDQLILVHTPHLED